MFIFLHFQTLIKFDLRYNEIGEQGALHLYNVFRENTVKFMFTQDQFDLDVYCFVDIDKTSTRW